MEWSLFSVEIDAWRIILCCLLVIVFRRVPTVLALKKFIPIVKTWQEAFFCGWFGPIGAGCIFYAMIAISMGIDQEPLFLIVGPIVLSSILFHGGSVGSFHLGLEKKKQASELTIVAL
jgi:NhaP-type Na+/H+ or K+/H+ antiporter